MTDRLTDQQLDMYAQLIANTTPAGAAVASPGMAAVLLAEIRRLRTQPSMVCINCETPVGWVDCPTGGWWAHEQHPADGHDADPRLAAEEMHVVADDSSDPDPLAYGPTGYRCGCGKDAHSNLVPCQPDLAEEQPAAEGAQPREVHGPDNHSEIAMRGWTA
jgi:hypothetical protein